MDASLEAFMEGVIDYAGLFPPSDLSLEPAITNFSEYRQGKDQHMLSRFIIPALRLDELDRYADSLFSENPPFRFSVLGKKTETISDYQYHLDELEKVLTQFNDNHNQLVSTDLLEMKIPHEAVLANDKQLLVDIFDQTAQRFGNSAVLPDRVFFEAFFEENWQKDIHNVLKALNAHNAPQEKPHYQYSGYKQRCGGVEAHMFPTVQQLAYALTEARKQDVAVKCTAGLHHPVRHYADEVNTKMHGFFNVFGGAMLSHANDLSGDELATIISDEDADNFSFTDEEFCWKDHRVSADEIKQLRETALISFGSCSFDEPREDLRQLGLY